MKNVLRIEHNQTLRMWRNQLKLWGADIRTFHPTTDPEQEIWLLNKERFARDGRYEIGTSTCFLWVRNVTNLHPRNWGTYYLLHIKNIAFNVYFVKNNDKLIITHENF